MTPRQPAPRPKPGRRPKPPAAKPRRLGGASLAQGLAEAARRVAEQRGKPKKREGPPVRVLLLATLGMAAATGAAVLLIVFRSSLPGAPEPISLPAPEIERGYGWYVMARSKPALFRVKEIIHAPGVRPGAHKEVKTHLVHGALRGLVVDEGRAPARPPEGAPPSAAVEEAAAGYAGGANRPAPYRKDDRGRLVRPRSPR